MPDEYSISTLSPAPTISNNDLVELACVDPSSETGFTSFNAKMTDLGNKFNNDIEYASALETSEKKPLSAINQVLHNFANTYSPSSTYALDECVVYQGTLYKCTTAITTAEAWNSAHWTAIKAVDVGSASILYGTSAPSSSSGSDGNLYVQYTEGTGGESDTVDGLFVKLDGEWCEISTGGGTGGGHTIVDEEGTSLEQQPNLQFNGAYLEDNSTDETTEVNVVRSMTYAEFQQLSEAEKKGFIDVSDITGYEQDKFQPVIYSEEEREIGVWIDGKPLYEKTLNVGTISVSTTVAHGVANLDTIVDYSGFGKYAGTDKAIIPFQNPASAYGFGINTYDGTNIIFAKSSSLGSNITDCYCTIRYTKSSDTPGSGQWTPQGVPAHHYSEDEQIVGTWIDGSTIYEKTYTSSTYYYTTAVALLDLSTLAYDKIISLRVESELTIAGDGVMYFMPSSDNAYINTDKKVYAKQSLAAQQSSRTMLSYITVRYTKPST